MVSSDEEEPEAPVATWVQVARRNRRDPDFPSIKAAVRKAKPGQKVSPPVQNARELAKALTEGDINPITGNKVVANLFKANRGDVVLRNGRVITRTIGPRRSEVRPDLVDAEQRARQAASDLFSFSTQNNIVRVRTTKGVHSEWYSGKTSRSYVLPTATSEEMLSSAIADWDPDNRSVALSLYRMIQKAKQANREVKLRRQAGRILPGTKVSALPAKGNANVLPEQKVVATSPVVVLPEPSAPRPKSILKSASPKTSRPVLSNDFSPLAEGKPVKKAGNVGFSEC